MSYYDQHQPPVSVPPQQGMHGFSWTKEIWSLWFLILFIGFVGYPKDGYPPPGYPVRKLLFWSPRPHFHFIQVCNNLSLTWYKEETNFMTQLVSCFMIFVPPFLSLNKDII